MQEAVINALTCVYAFNPYNNLKEMLFYSHCPDEAVEVLRD